MYEDVLPAVDGRDEAEPPVVVPGVQLAATAPSPRRTRILLAEKGIQHETVWVDLRTGEQMGAAFRAINPQCTVPALRTEEGSVLTDNAGIAAYLEAKFPEPPLLGRTPLEKAQIASWNWRVEFEGLVAIAEALRNSSPAMVNRALRRTDCPQVVLGPQRSPKTINEHAPRVSPPVSASACHISLLVRVEASPTQPQYAPFQPSLRGC